MELRNSYHLPDCSSHLAGVLRQHHCRVCGDAGMTKPTATPARQNRNTAPERTQGCNRANDDGSSFMYYHTVFAMRACRFRPPAACAAYDGCISWLHNFILCSSQSHLGFFGATGNNTAAPKPHTATHPWCGGH